MQKPVEEIACSPFTRRSFFRFAAGASALASMPILTESHLALAQRPKFAPVNQGVHIDANENPLGPSEAAREAVAKIIPLGGRYDMDIQFDLVDTIAKQEGIHPDWIMAYPGSSEPLHYVVLAYTGPGKPLVVADPGYEAPMMAAKFAKAPILKVPLADPKGAATHNIKAMLAASSTPGVIYICNPNNPTGTVTPKEEIEHAVMRAPKGTILLIDEAYIHLSNAPSAMEYVRAGKDVVVLRTFSKIYGMAGLRLGYAAGRPALLDKLIEKGGLASLPVTAAAAGKASLDEADLIPKRRRIIGDVRAETIAWLNSKGYACTPSESNCFMLDVKRPGKQVLEAMATKEVYIGRIWPAWPNHVRITVGTAEEMMTFRKAFSEVMGNLSAGIQMPAMPGRVNEQRMRFLS